MRNGSRLHRFWWWWNDTMWLPRWPWRIYCWFAGHGDDSYGACWCCGAPSRPSPPEEE